ncbi:MAG: hypothetical protein ACM3PT_09480 [Deltaproteobacteria bacterium]
MDSVVAFNLLKAFSYWNFKLSDPAKTILLALKDKSEIWALIKESFEHNKWTKEENSKLSKLFD